MGMLTKKSQFSLIFFEIPFPSAPTTKAIEPVKSSLYISLPHISAPVTQTPFSFSSFIVCVRFPTLAISVWAAAPADVLKTTAFTPTARFFGMITPCAPTAFAVLMIAPRLCGSVISSHIMMNGFWFFFFIPSLFLFFHKNFYLFTKGKEPARSPKPDSFKFELFTVDISSHVTPARFSRARLDAAVQSSVALLGVIRCSYPPTSLGTA